MAEPRKERSVRDETIIKLVLFGIRNVAQIAQPLDLPADGDEVEISRSTTIDAFHYQDIFQFILTLASSMGDEFDEQDVVVLEVLFHIVKGIDPKGIFKKDEQALQANTNELRELMRKEKKMLAGYARHAPTRHNRFGTMVWLKRDDERMSTISGQTAISGPDRGMQHMNKTKKWNKPKNRGRNVEDKGSV
jgi:replication fork protection complex subunit Tof1/Swi1